MAVSCQGGGKQSGGSRPVVVARLRPRSPKETAASTPLLVSISKDDGVVHVAPGPHSRQKSVHVTHALSEEAEQEDVWSLFEGYLEDFLDRINVTLFSYGETGSGKTYTMSYLTLRFLNELLARGAGYDEFDVTVGMVEIDNERIFDLLSEERESLSIMNHQVKGAKWAKVITEGDCQSVLHECWKRRRTEATEFNECSSRSHAVCTVSLHASKDGVSFASTAHICDLAGSERTGMSAKDGSPNASLTLMAMIVKDLAAGRTRRNFRQSKLTHLLQPALTGKCRLGLVFTLNPCSARGATSTLRFAQNMMNMPEAKLARNPVRMTEAQLRAASEALVKKEATIQQQLKDARNQQLEMELENHRLHGELNDSHEENLRVIGENKRLMAALANEASAAATDRWADCAILQDCASRYDRHALEVSRAIQDATARDPGDAALRKVGDAVAGLATLFSRVSHCCGSGDDQVLGKLISDLAPKLQDIASSQEPLQGLVPRAAPPDPEQRREAAHLSGLELHVRSLIESCRGLQPQLENLKRRAQEVSERRVESNRLAEDTRIRMSRASGIGRAPEQDDSMLMTSALRRNIEAMPDEGTYEKLGHICALSKYYAVEFQRLGGVERLVTHGLLPFEPGSEEACRSAAFLPRVCVLHESRDQVRAHGGCAFLVRMLQTAGGSEADDARIAACGAVACLCAGNEFNKDLFAEEAMPALMELVTSESQHVQEAALAALGEIAEGSRLAKDRANAAGVLGLLLLSTVAPNHHVKLEAARTVGRLVADHKGNQRQMAQLELEMKEFSWVPVNGIACLACGLVEEDLSLQLSFAQAALNCVYDDADNLAALFSKETLALAGLEGQQVHARLLQALAARVCSLLPHGPGAAGPEGVQSVLSRLEWALPHYSVALTGSWDRRAPSKRGGGPSDEAFVKNPQYCLLADSPMQVCLHMEVDEEAAPGGMGPQASVEFYSARAGPGSWEVAFAKPGKKRLVRGRNMVSAVLEVESAGAYVVVPTLSGSRGGASATRAGFRMAIAAAAEIEVQPMSYMQGWDEASCEQVAQGSWAGYWKGGDHPGSPFFWRNPQVLLRPSRGLASSYETASHASDGDSVSDDDNNDDDDAGEKIIVAVHSHTEGLLSEDHSAKTASEACPGLAVFRACKGPSGTPRRHLGTPIVLGEEEAGDGDAAADLSSAVNCTTLVSSPGYAVVEVAVPDDGGDLALCPYLPSSADGAKFSLRCFSALPGLQLCSYSAEQEWQRFYTYKLRWGPQRQIELCVKLPAAEVGAAPSSGAEGGAASAVALRFPGVPAGSAADVSWEEQGGPSSRAPELRGGVKLDGASLTFTVGSGSCYRLWLKRTDSIVTDKAVIVQILSDVPLDTANLPQDLRQEAVSSHLPCPVSVASASPGQPALMGLVKSRWSLQAAKARQAADQVRSMVHEIKQQVEIMRRGHESPGLRDLRAEDRARARSAGSPPKSFRDLFRRTHAAPDEASSSPASLCGSPDKPRAAHCGGLASNNEPLLPWRAGENADWSPGTAEGTRRRANSDNGGDSASPQEEDDECGDNSSSNSSSQNKRATACRRLLGGRLCLDISETEQGRTRIRRGQSPEHGNGGLTTPRVRISFEASEEPARRSRSSSLDERLMGSSGPCAPVRLRGASLDCPRRGSNLRPLHVESEVSVCAERDAALAENKRLRAKIAELEGLIGGAGVYSKARTADGVFNALTGEWMVRGDP